MPLVAAPYDFVLAPGDEGDQIVRLQLREHQKVEVRSAAPPSAYRSVEACCEEICAEDKPRAPAEVSGELGNVHLDVQLVFG